MDSAFLDGTQSELSDFGETGAEGFASAWGVDGGGLHLEGDEDLFEQFEDRASHRARDLDRRSRRGLVVLALVLLLGAGAAVAVRTGVLGDQAEPAVDEGSSAGSLLAIGDVRDYDDRPTAISLTNPSGLDQSFRTELPGGDPYPIEDSGSVPSDVDFGVIFWGGRTHVVVIGAAVGESDLCVVASLVASDLRPVDVAAHGTCEASYSATGDRLACRGTNVVLLEVWPYDPDAVIAKPAVDSIRVRIERDGRADGSKESRRGVAAIEGELVDAADLLGGAPGDVVTLEGGAQTGTCELLQRAEVQVQLL